MLQNFGLKQIMAAAGGSDSSEDAAFKDFILYVLMEGDRNSSRALSLLHANTDIFARTFIQDVRGMRSRPSFLTGVPILVDKISGLAYRGTEVFRFLQRGSSEDAPPVTGATGMVGRKLKKTSRLAAGSAMRTRGNFMNLADAFDAVEEESSLHREVERVSHSERTMEDFERLRASVEESAKRVQSAAAGHGSLMA